MYRKIKKYVPSTEDKAWLNNTLDILENDGRLVTDLVVYKKKNDVIKGVSLHLVCVNPIFQEMGLGMFEVNMEVLKMKAVADAIGISFYDNRKAAWN